MDSEGVGILDRVRPEIKIRMNDIEFACKCIEAIGDIVLKNPSMEIYCIRTLIMLLKTVESEKVAAAVVALRKLLCNVRFRIM